jgi:hypothetical protein
MLLKISSMKGVIEFQEEEEVGIQGCLTRPDNSFLKIILGQYTYHCFGLKDSRVRKSLSIGLWVGYPSTRTACGITQLGC